MRAIGRAQTEWNGSAVFKLLYSNLRQLSGCGIGMRRRGGRRTRASFAARTCLAVSTVAKSRKTAAVRILHTISAGARANDRLWSQVIGGTLGRGAVRKSGSPPKKLADIRV